MAERHWVGGDGNWSSTSHWSTTKDGSSGSSVPDGTFDVIFDSDSNYICTIDSNAVACKSIQFLGTTATAQLINESAHTGNLNIAGKNGSNYAMDIQNTNAVIDLTYGTGGGSNTIAFAANASCTIHTSGVQLKATAVVFNSSGSSGSWSLEDALSVSGGISLQRGTFDANDQNVTATGVTTGSSNTKVLTMGNGTWTLTASSDSPPIWGMGASGLTVNAEGSTLTSTGTGNRTLVCNNLALNNLSFAPTSTASGTITINGCSCVDLTFNSNITGSLADTAITIAGALTIGASMTVTSGSSEMTFSATTGPKLITSNGKAINRPLVFNGSGGSWKPADALSTDGPIQLKAGSFDADDKNITAARVVCATSGTKSLSMGSGTWTLTGDSADESPVWGFGGVTVTFDAETSTINSTNSGANAKNFALGDYYTLHNVKISAGSGTVSFTGTSAMVCSDLDFTDFAGTWAADPVEINGVGGNLTLGTGMTVTAGEASITFSNPSGSSVITTNGVSVDRPVVFSGSSGSWTLADAFSSGSSITITSGTLTFDANVAVSKFISSGSNAKTIDFTTKTLEITSTSAETVVSFYGTETITMGSLGEEIATILISGSTTNIRTFNGAGLSFTKIAYTNATSGGEIDFINNCTADLIYSDSSNQTMKFDAGGSYSLADIQIVSTPLTIGTVGTGHHTLIKTGHSVINGTGLTISDSWAEPEGTWFAGLDSTDNGNNSGWIFSTGSPSVAREQLIAQVADYGFARPDTDADIATALEAVIEAEEGPAAVPGLTFDNYVPTSLSSLEGFMRDDEVVPNKYYSIILGGPCFDSLARDFHDILLPAVPGSGLVAFKLAGITDFRFCGHSSTIGALTSYNEPGGDGNTVGLAPCIYLNVPNSDYKEILKLKTIAGDTVDGYGVVFVLNNSTNQFLFYGAGINILMTTVCATVIGVLTAVFSEFTGRGLLVKSRYTNTAEGRAAFTTIFSGENQNTWVTRLKDEESH